MTDKIFIFEEQDAERFLCIAVHQYNIVPFRSASAPERNGSILKECQSIEIRAKDDDDDIVHVVAWKGAMLLLLSKTYLAPSIFVWGCAVEIFFLN